MGREVMKYTLASHDERLPLASTDTIMSAGIQDDEIVVWAARDPRCNFWGGRRVICVNTGDAVPDVVRQHIGTVTTARGIVWHVMEVV